MTPFKHRYSWLLFLGLATLMFLMGGLAYPPGRYPIWWDIVGALLSLSVAFLVARILDGLKRTGNG